MKSLKNIVVTGMAALTLGLSSCAIPERSTMYVRYAPDWRPVYVDIDGDGILDRIYYSDPAPYFYVEYGFFVGPHHFYGPQVKHGHHHHFHKHKKYDHRDFGNHRDHDRGGTRRGGR